MDELLGGGVTANVTASVTPTVTFVTVAHLDELLGGAAHRNVRNGAAIDVDPQLQLTAIHLKRVNGLAAIVHEAAVSGSLRPDFEHSSVAECRTTIPNLIHPKVHRLRRCGADEIRRIMRSTTVGMMARPWG